MYLIYQGLISQALRVRLAHTTVRIFSGIRPTGNIHLGNYLGAVKQWIELQDKNECIFMLADLHAITTPYDPKELKKNSSEKQSQRLT